MAILDIFKKKKQKKEEIKKEAEKPPEVKVKKKPAKRKKEVKLEKPSKPKRTSETAYRILKEPHVTEKATDLAGANQYIFKVLPRANKTEIKKAVEDLYGVNVVSVKIVKVPRRRRRLGRIEGWRSGYKKAVVKIQKGQKIEVLPR